MFRILSQHSGQQITPGVEIFADGRCIVRNFQGEEFKKRLHASEVDKLLMFFEREQFFSLSDASIKHAIDRELEPVYTELTDGEAWMSIRGPVIVIDSNYTKIAARTHSKSVEISQYALDSELDCHPTVTELRTLKRCIDRVYEVAGRIRQ